MKKILPAFLAAAICCSFLQPKSFQFSSVEKINREEEKRNEAFDALHFFTRAASYPLNQIPENAYGLAFDKWKQTVSLIHSGGRSSSWTSVGPNNIGGRTLCIAFDPNDTSTIWLGSASGGLWKSTTGGIGTNAFQFIPTGFPTLGVSSIAINPNNPQEMFIGTGETYYLGPISTNGLDDRTQRGTFGMGILKSVDGGASWNPSLNWLYHDNKGVWDVKFNPMRPQTLWTATTDGIFRTLDGGTNWVNVLNIPMCMDLAVDPVDTTILFCGVGNLNSAGKGLYRSADGGATWSIVTTGLPPNTHHGRITVEIAPSNHNIVMCGVGDTFSTVGLFRSTNGGLGFSQMSISDYHSWQGWYANGLCIKSNNPNQILVGGVELFNSTTGGSGLNQVTNITWNGDYMHSDVHFIISNPQNPNHVYIATDGGLFRSNDFGATFYECTDGYTTGQFYIGSSSATTSGYLTGGLQDNNSYLYQNSPYWMGIYGGDGMYNLIHPQDDLTYFVSYQYLNVMKTIDGGANLNQVISTNSNPSGGNPAAFLAPFAMSPKDNAVMYAGDENLQKSTDVGDTFFPVGPTPVNGGNHLLCIGLSSSDVNHLYIATTPDGPNPMKVLRSWDGGNSYTDITGTLPLRYARRIAVDPTNDSILYITFSGFNCGHIFKSTDAGNSWTDISTALPDLPFHVITIDPLAHTYLYAGCDFGVYFSNDGGTNWMPLPVGLPFTTMIFDLVVSPGDRMIYAFTHGNGVYVRDMITPVGVPVLNHDAKNFTAWISNGALFVKADQSFLQQPLELFSADGKKVFSATLKNGTENFNLPALSDGIYFLNTQAEGKIVSKKLVYIQHP